MTVHQFPTARACYVPPPPDIEPADLLTSEGYLIFHEITKPDVSFARAAIFGVGMFWIGIAVHWAWLRAMT